MGNVLSCALLLSDGGREDERGVTDEDRAYEFTDIAQEEEVEVEYGVKEIDKNEEEIVKEELEGEEAIRRNKRRFCRSR